ncbi:hypothetical protein GSG61_24015 [Escherichia coli]|uniref:hypothetical protein n=1 Tax=Escherichia coli TaxID=562 RepID=UPI0017A14A56|nr:hypothetical protein [Escherichia coli]EAR5616111.1 hypothetical protein [Salmonella enterica]EEQ9398116.1 hypothetical protein [Escherichia coli]EFF8876817.1 hypothetical protein [Escherichia coli]EFI6374955.1 hypothetical protein [Escherichia coli]EHU3874569.1 hypothetical protein [Escherichia coli]
MKDDRQTLPVPDAWKICFLAPGTLFYTDDAAVTKERLRAHCDDVDLIPLCRMHDGPVFREHHINELSAALARMLHMLRERTRYRENIHDAECIREIHEAPLQALNIVEKYKRTNHKDVLCGY